MESTIILVFLSLNILLSPDYQTLVINYYTSTQFVPLKMFFFFFFLPPNHAVRNTSLKHVTKLLSSLIVTIKCYTSFVCLSVCWLLLFLFFFFLFCFVFFLPFCFFCFTSGNGSVMTYNIQCQCQIFSN